MKILNNMNSRTLVKYVLENKKGIEVKEIKGNKIDFIITKEDDLSKRFGINVTYRNIPCEETRSEVWTYQEIQKIKDTCSVENMIPTVAFALCDEESETTYIFMLTVQMLEDLSKNDSTNDIFKRTKNGFQIKYGIGHSTKKELLDRLKYYVGYTEIIVDKMSFLD